MFRALLLAFSLCAISVLAGDLSALNIEYAGSEQITGLPAVTWEFHLAATQQVVAIIEADREVLEIFKPGSSPISVVADGDRLFFSVSASSRSGVLMTGEFFRDGSSGYKWAGRNYDGQIVLGPVVTRATVDVSPCGEYFYSIFDVGNEFNKPVLYRASGELMSQFDCRTGNWDIRFLSDSSLMYRDGSDITIYAVPQLTPIVSYSTGPMKNADLPYAALSFDRSAYAFQSCDDIVVVDLVGGNVSKIGKAGYGPVPAFPRVALADSGQILAVIGCYDAKEQVDIFLKKGGDYERVAGPLDFSLSDGFTLTASAPFIQDGLLVVNHCRVADSMLVYEASILDVRCKLSPRDCREVVAGLVQRSAQSTFEMISFSKSSATITNVNMGRVK